MSRNEFEGWAMYHELHPLDDYRRIFHPAAVLCALLERSGDVGKFLDRLAPDKANEGLTDVDLSFMRAFGLRRRGDIPREA